MMWNQCRGTGKSHLVKVIYNAISKTLLYDFKDPKIHRVLFFGTTKISAVNVNIGRTIIHSSLVIKPGTNLLGLSDKSKAALNNRLRGVKNLIIDKLFMVSSDLWTGIKGAVTNIGYFARSKFSMSLVHKKKFSLICQVVFKLGYIFCQER